MGRYVREAFTQEFGEEDNSPLIDLVRHAFVTLATRSTEKRKLERALRQVRDAVAVVPVTSPASSQFDELDCILLNVAEIRKQPEVITWEQDIWLTTIECHAKMLIRKRTA